jgi:hypothetical protein
MVNINEFTYHVWETQIAWLTSESENFKILFMCILLASANPKREWSVKHVWYPIVLAMKRPSRAIVENPYKLQLEFDNLFSLVYRYTHSLSFSFSFSFSDSEWREREREMYLMTMNNFNLFADKYFSQERKEHWKYNSGERTLIIKIALRQIVHFESVCQIANPFSLSITVSYDNNLPPMCTKLFCQFMSHIYLVLNTYVFDMVCVCVCVCVY